MGNNIQSSASCPSNPTQRKMSGTLISIRSKVPIIAMNSVEESPKERQNDTLSKFLLRNLSYSIYFRWYNIVKEPTLFICTLCYFDIFS